MENGPSEDVFPIGHGDIPTKKKGPITMNLDVKKKQMAVKCVCD